MPPRHSRHWLLAGMGFLSLLAALLLPLDALLPATAAASEAPPVLMLGVLGTLLSCGWFLLGYALGALLRLPGQPPVPLQSPPPTELSRMTTEQLYRELERMNRETLLYETRLTHRGPLTTPHERRENDFSSA